MPVYFNEKTKKYYAAFYYTDWQGNRKKKKKEGFALARDAKAFEKDFLNRTAGDCTMTFDTLVTYYLEDDRTRRKPTTHMVKLHNIKKHFLPVFGKMQLTDIKPMTIRKWQNDIINQDYSPSYQRWLSASLNCLFNYAVKYYGLKSNPAQVAGSIGTNYNNRNIGFWTIAEFNQFLAVLQNRKLEKDRSAYTAAFNILFYSGIRLGELLAMRIGDYSSQEKTLRINKTLASVKGKKILQPPKTKKSNRIVTLPATICKIIDTYMNDIYEPQPSNPLFFSLTETKIRYTFYKIIDENGLKPIRIHDLRHSHASLLIEMGVNPLAISERLGHNNVQTTLNIYSHLYPNKAEEVANNLEKIIVNQ